MAVYNEPTIFNSPRWSPDGKIAGVSFLESRRTNTNFNSSGDRHTDPAASVSPTLGAGPTPAPAAGAASGAAPSDTNARASLSAINERWRSTTHYKLEEWREHHFAGRLTARGWLSSAASDQAIAAPENKERSDVRHYKNISYKFNDTGWFDDRRTHLWVVDVKSGSAKQITEGHDWNDSDPQWSPDGTRIAFVSNRTGKEYDENRNTDVWVISV